MDEQNIATNVEVDNSQLNTTPTTDTSNTATNIEVDNSQINVPTETPQEQITNAANEGDFNETPPLQPQVPEVEKPEGLPDLSQQVAQMEIDQNYEENLQYNNGRALQNFLENEYDYDKNEAGTYWVAGAINDVDTQMKFLDTLINEEMYDEMELTKFYYDNTMATARAYAAQKKKEVAYGFYRAAQEKAIAEASLTGWYMPAEGEYMLGQYTIAQNTMDRTDTTPQEKARAQRVINVTEKWFNANHIGTRGMKCLSLLQYEETVRHNKAAEALQHQANQIAAAGNAISAAGNDLALREWKFSLEEMELQTGHDWTGEAGLDNDNIIGHNQERDYKRFQNLRGYGDKEVYQKRTLNIDPTKELAYTKSEDEEVKDIFEANKKYYKQKGLDLKQDDDGNWYADGNVKISGLANLLTQDPYYYSAIIGAIGSEAVNETLKENGIDPKEYYARYQSYLGDKSLAENYEKNGAVLDESYLNPETWKVSASDKKYGQYKDKKIYTFHTNENGKSVTLCYVKDNNDVYRQINADSVKLQDGTTLADKVTNFSKNELTYKGEKMQIGNNYDTGAQSASVKNNWKNYDRLTDGGNNDIKNSHAKKIEEYEAKGYVWLSSKHGDSGAFDIDAGTVMYNPEKDEYITISDIRDKVEVKKKSAIKEVGQPNWKVGDTFYEDGGGKYAYMKQNSITIGETTNKDKSGDSIKTKAYMFVDGNGNAHYYKLGKDGTNDKLTNDYTIISEAEAKKINPNIESMTDDINNYRANIKTTKVETKAGKNSDTIAKESYENTQKELAESASSSGGSGGSKGGSSPRNVSTKNGDAEDTDVYHIEKTSVDMEGAPDLLSKETPYILNDKKQTVNDVTNNDQEKKKVVKKETTTTNKKKKASV